MLRAIFHTANYRNLPFGRRATCDSLVHLPRKEYTRSRHQRLFEENVGKTRKDVVCEL